MLEKPMASAAAKDKKTDRFIIKELQTKVSRRLSIGVVGLTNPQ
jgi:hypothetical protein